MQYNSLHNCLIFCPICPLFQKHALTFDLWPLTTPPPFSLQTNIAYVMKEYGWTVEDCGLRKVICHEEYLLFRFIYSHRLPRTHNTADLADLTSWPLEHILSMDQGHLYTFCDKVPRLIVWQSPRLFLEHLGLVKTISFYLYDLLMLLPSQDVLYL